MTVLRSVRWTIGAGLALAFGLTLFIDIAVLSVPIYDMQLYDRVLMSRNMDTLGMLSVACIVGLIFYGLLDYLRSSAFVAISRHRRPTSERARSGSRDPASGWGR